MTIPFYGDPKSEREPKMIPEMFLTGIATPKYRKFNHSRCKISTSENNDEGARAASIATPILVETHNGHSRVTEPRQDASMALSILGIFFRSRKVSNPAS
jgi:hypothetical protein